MGSVETDGVDSLTRFLTFRRLATRLRSDSRLANARLPYPLQPTR